MSRCEKAEPCLSWRVQAGSGPLFPPPWNGNFSFPALFRRMKRKAGKIKMPHFPAVLRIILGHYQQQVGGAILPTLGCGKQSVWLAASGSRRSFRAEARTHFICRKRKCCGAFTHQEKKSRRAAPVPPCVRRLDTGHRWSQQTRMSPLRGPCRRRTRPENGCPKGCHIFHFSAGFFLSEHDSSALGYGCFAGTRGRSILELG